MPSTLERIIEFSAAYDKRPMYGVHGVEMRMVLKGPEGAVQFVLSTGWQLPHVHAEWKAKGLNEYFPLPFDLGYHSYVSRFEGQTIVTNSCPWLDGKPCYYEGSSLQAQDVFDLLVREGGEAVWCKLEERYNDWLKELPANA